MFDGESADRAALRVRAKSRLGEGLVGLELERTDGARLPDWTAGSHIDLILPDGICRQYSLSGDPRDAHHFEIAVLREQQSRGGSAYIHDTLRVGDELGFGGPRNNFPLVPSPKISFIAGGIGITPIIAMLRQATLLGADWRLLYLGRGRDTMAFLPELAEYGERVMIHSGAEPRADLRAWIGGERADTKLYVCGPDRLLSAVEVETAGWRPGWARMERFTARHLEAPARPGPFTVELARSKKSITVRPDDTIASAIRAEGIAILTSCGAGLCGTCETAVLSGEPDHRDSILDESERSHANVMFPCVSRSRTERLVLDL